MQEIAPEAIQHLANEYPFFTPVHYFLWINGRKDKTMMASLRESHPVNPVMLGNLVRAASAVPEVVMVETVLMTETVIVAPEVPENTTNSVTDDKLNHTDDLSFMQPVFSEDYFLQQGIKVSSDIPEFAEMAPEPETEEEKEKALMVVMSFTEWLKHINSRNRKEKEEEADKKALKAMWQQQKLAEAIEEESEEIPEQVFEMAVNSIARKEELVSESLANVYAKQGKIGKAIEMYQKLSLLNPEKNAYFASKIENLQKEI